jgi:small subunit ribosomal protein S20
MANTKSAMKNARKSLRQAARNKAVKTRLKTLAKNVAAAAATGNAENARAAAIAFSSALDRAVKSGVIHANNASRHKSQVAQYISGKKAPPADAAAPAPAAS